MNRLLSGGQKTIKQTLKGFLSSSCRCWWMWSRRSVSMSRHSGWSKCWPKRKKNLIEAKSCYIRQSCHNRSRNWRQSCQGVTARINGNHGPLCHAIIGKPVTLGHAMSRYLQTCHTRSRYFRQSCHTKVRLFNNFCLSHYLGDSVTY